MMENKQNNLIWWVWGAATLALPLGAAVLLWDKLPARMPIHWNIEGKPDGYAPKETAIVLLVGINVFLYALSAILPKIDPKKNFAQFKTSYRWIIFSVATLTATITSLVVFNSAGYQFDLFKAILTILLLALMIMGNFMGKLRPNYFVGIRTPWTIDNDDVWTKTHRLAGQTWVTTAIILLVILYAIQLPMWVFFVSIIIMALVPTAYSYMLHKQLKDQ